MQVVSVVRVMLKKVSCRLRVEDSESLWIDSLGSLSQRSGFKLGSRPSCLVWLSTMHLASIIQLDNSYPRDRNVGNMIDRDDQCHLNSNISWSKPGPAAGTFCFFCAEVWRNTWLGEQHRSAELEWQPQHLFKHLWISLAAPNVVCSHFNCQMKPVVPKAIAQVPQLLHVGWRDSEKWLSATSVDLLGSKVFWLLTFVSLYSDPSSDQPNLCYSSCICLWELLWALGAMVGLVRSATHCMTFALRSAASTLGQTAHGWNLPQFQMEAKNSTWMDLSRVVTNLMPHLKYTS